MNCVLTKSVNTAKGKDGKEVKFTNYYLVFDNGDVLPIELKNYTSSDAKKKEQLEKVNYANWIKLNTLATLVKNDEDK